MLRCSHDRCRRLDRNICAGAESASTRLDAERQRASNARDWWSRALRANDSTATSNSGVGRSDPRLKLRAPVQFESDVCNPVRDTAVHEIVEVLGGGADPSVALDCCCIVRNDIFRILHDSSDVLIGAERRDALR